MIRQLLWVEHVFRMGDERKPKAVFFFYEMNCDRRTRGAPENVLKTNLGTSLALTFIEESPWQDAASERDRWSFSYYLNATGNTFATECRQRRKKKLQKKT